MALVCPKREGLSEPTPGRHTHRARARARKREGVGSCLPPSKQCKSQAGTSEQRRELGHVQARVHTVHTALGVSAQPPHTHCPNLPFYTPRAGVSSELPPSSKCSSKARRQLPPAPAGQTHSHTTAPRTSTSPGPGAGAGEGDRPSFPSGRGRWVSQKAEPPRESRVHW